MNKLISYEREIKFLLALDLKCKSSYGAFTLTSMLTRLHSSRMRTARALTVSPSMLCAGGGVSAPRGYLVPGGVSVPRGRVSVPGGLLPGGGDVPTCSPIHKAAVRPAAVQNMVWRSFCTAVFFDILGITPGKPVERPWTLRPVALWIALLGGWYPSTHWGRPPCEQNHIRLWKYNLAPTSLRAVKILSSFAATKELLETGWVLFALSIYSWRMKSMLSGWPGFPRLCHSEL